MELSDVVLHVVRARRFVLHRVLQVTFEKPVEELLDVRRRRRGRRWDSRWTGLGRGGWSCSRYCRWCLGSSGRGLVRRRNRRGRRADLGGLGRWRRHR
jgi:hypothetical protein